MSSKPSTGAARGAGASASREARGGTSCRDCSLVPLVGGLLAFARVLVTRRECVLRPTIVDDVLLNTGAADILGRPAARGCSPRGILGLLGLALHRLAEPFQLLVALVHRCLLGAGGRGYPFSAHMHRAPLGSPPH